MHRPFYLFIIVCSLLLTHLSLFGYVLADDNHFEGFEAEEDDVFDDLPHSVHPPPVTQSESLVLDPTPPSPDPDPLEASQSDPPPLESVSTKSSPDSFELWDEEEFEGLPVGQSPLEPPAENTIPADQGNTETTTAKPQDNSGSSKSYTLEMLCLSFLIAFTINYFIGKRENEKLALAWASKFATKNSIFDKNFSMLGVGDGEGEESPLLLKEGLNVFKFYASGRRYCRGMLGTIELKSRHDLSSMLLNLVVPARDEICLEVYMNDEAMDHVVFALTKKRSAKGMQKQVRDLQRFATVLNGRNNWVSDHLSVISESKELAGDFITDAVLDQVFGEKAFEKYEKDFISMHFSDQHPGTHKKMLVFRFALPDSKHMDEITRLVALVPYYIDLIGRHKLSPQARLKTEAARQKAAQEAYRELQNARQDALQRNKVARRHMDEAEIKLSADILRKKEAKDRGRQNKKATPKIKMSRAH